MKTGTTFNSGQLAQLQNDVNIAVATAMPKVAKGLDPKITLKALNGRGEIFAGHIEVALKQALNRMFMLGSDGSIVVKLAERHDPSTFYQTRSGLYVYNSFRNLVVAKAKPTEAGVIFNLDHALLKEKITDEMIEESLPKAHLFNETILCATLATMITNQWGGKKGKLLNNGYANLFYTGSCVVDVYWGAVFAEWYVYTWKRGDGEWDAGNQVFSPATEA